MVMYFQEGIFRFPGLFPLPSHFPRKSHLALVFFGLISTVFFSLIVVFSFQKTGKLPSSSKYYWDPVRERRILISLSCWYESTCWCFSHIPFIELDFFVIPRPHWLHLPWRWHRCPQRHPRVRMLSRMKSSGEKAKAYSLYRGLGVSPPPTPNPTKAKAYSTISALDWKKYSGGTTSLSCALSMLFFTLLLFTSSFSVCQCREDQGRPLQNW